MKTAYLYRMTNAPNFIHHGRNIQRLRELLLRMKQETFAAKLNWDRSKLSRLEQKPVIDESILNEIAVAFNMPIEILTNFSDEQVIQIIQNNYKGATNNSTIQHYQCNFNTEYMEQLQQAHNKINDLYQDLLKVEREKNELLEKLLKDKQ